MLVWAALFGVIFANNGPDKSALVLIPDADGPEACVVAEELVTALELTPGYRVVRAPLDKGEKLEAAKKRFGAALAIQGRRDFVDQGEVVELSIVGDGAEAKVKQKAGTGLGLGLALAGAWPKNGPSPLLMLDRAAANGPALDAACRGNAEEAALRSGAAISRTVARLVKLPDAALKGNLLARWGRASNLVAQKKPALAVPLLRGVIAELDAGQLAPVWRRSDPITSSIQVGPEETVGFGAGAFYGLDLATGARRWEALVGSAQPELFDAGDGLAIGVLAKEVLGVETKTGKIRFRAPYEGAQPELVGTRNKLYLAAGEATIALDRTSGKMIWSHDSLSNPIAGPVLARGEIATPLVAAIAFHDPETGAVSATVKLGDELTAPLTVTASGKIWALVGSDEVLLLDTEQHRIETRLKDLPGIEWPPAVLGEQLVVATKKGPLRLATILDPKAKNGIKQVLKGAAPPILALPDYSGILHLEERPPAVIARAIDGRVLWRHTARERINVLRLAGDRVLFAAGKRVRALDRQKGKLLHEYELDERIIDVAFGSNGGAALTASGVLYGLPGDRDQRALDWAKKARLELAMVHLSLGQPLPAIALAKNVLDRDPKNVEALALLATAKARARPAEGAGELLGLLGEIGPSEPLALTAIAELTNRIGLIEIASGEAGAKAVALLEQEDPSTSTTGVIVPQALVARATVAGGRLLYELEKRAPRPNAPPSTWLFGVAQESLARAFEHQVPGRYRIVAGADGWALVGERTVRWLDAATGRLSPSIVMPGPLVDVALPGGTLIYARLADHQLLAINGATALIRGRIRLGEIKRIVGRDGKLAVEEANGRVLILDATKVLGLAR